MRFEFWHTETQDVKEQDGFGAVLEIMRLEGVSLSETTKRAESRLADAGLVLFRGCYPHRKLRW